MSAVDVLASGPAGLVLGAVLGLLLGVFFEDRLKNLRAGSVKRLRRALLTRTPHVRRASFSIGPLRTGCVVVEGDGENGIHEDDVRILVDHRMVELPPEVERCR